jgi:hypothetical protein
VLVNELILLYKKEVEEGEGEGEESKRGRGHTQIVYTLQLVRGC